MYETTCDNEKELVYMSYELLISLDEFEYILNKVYSDWKYSVENNLSNKSCNRQAWLGQAACCYNHKCPEYLTRKAWSMLSNMQRYEANLIADKFIKKYERENSELHKGMGIEMLF